MKNRSWGGIVLAVLVAAALGAFALPARPAAAAPAPKSLIGAKATGATAMPATRKPRSATAAKLTLTSKVADAALAAKSLGSTQALQDLRCEEFIDWFATDVGEDKFLEETVDVYYQADVECTYYLNEIYGAAGTYDRSPSFNGQAFDGAG